MIGCSWTCCARKPRAGTLVRPAKPGVCASKHNQGVLRGSLCAGCWCAARQAGCCECNVLSVCGVALRVPSKPVSMPQRSAMAR